MSHCFSYVLFSSEIDIYMFVAPSYIHIMQLCMTGLNEAVNAELTLLLPNFDRK